MWWPAMIQIGHGGFCVCPGHTRPLEYGSFDRYLAFKMLPRLALDEGVGTVQINISTRHGHLSEATQAKISAKLERVLRLFERLTAIEVTVDLQDRDSPIVDLRISAEHKHDFVATEQAGDLMACIDGTMRKVEQQLRKYKEKVQDHHKSPGLRGQSAPTEHEPAGE